jgi:nucleotide-binding universal stress UspA family protein
LVCVGRPRAGPTAARQGHSKRRSSAPDHTATQREPSTSTASPSGSPGSIAIQLARGGSLLAAVPNERQLDQEEITAAQLIADEGAAGARGRGYNASARVAEATESVAKTIREVAREIDARLIVCGQRGRGAFASAVLGSVSHQLSAHAERPVLIAPQHPAA